VEPASLVEIFEAEDQVEVGQGELGERVGRVAEAGGQQPARHLGSRRELDLLQPRHHLRVQLLGHLCTSCGQLLHLFFFFCFCYFILYYVSF
jgi:hypothetical protein